MAGHASERNITAMLLEGKPGLAVGREEECLIPALRQPFDHGHVRPEPQRRGYSDEADEPDESEARENQSLAFSAPPRGEPDAGLGDESFQTRPHNSNVARRSLTFGAGLTKD